MQNFGHFCCISWEFLEQKIFKFLKIDRNWFYLIEQASDMSKITFSVIVYAWCLNKNKNKHKQMNSSALTFFWSTPYVVVWTQVLREIARSLSFVPITTVIALNFWQS